MFCGCPADHFTKEPNTQTCPLCLGLPGALPVPNVKAIEWTMMIGHALHCTINKQSKFDRKHYFYPDLPKGYQISQYDEPLCGPGFIEVPSGKINITRVHLEEDTGKLQHTTLNGEKVSLVDFNRGGVPLVEIVSEPDIRSSSQAKEYAQTIRQTINFLGVSDADMEKGTMRLEANISLAKVNNTTDKITNFPDYKVEVKNINSFRFLEKAIDFELARQQEILETGELPKQETRGFDEATMSTKPQRSKEEAKDYRYFPEPDIPPMEFTNEQIKEILKDVPLLPADYVNKFTSVYKIKPESAQSLTASRKVTEKALAAFELASKAKVEPQKVANFIINKKTEAIELSAQEIVKKFTLSSVDTSFDLAPLVSSVIASNPDVVEKYKAGKTAVMGVLIGQVMQQAKGKVDPAKVKSLLEKTLS